MKKWIALIMTMVLVVCACPIVLAANAGDACVVLGADLTQEQIAEVYRHFTLTRGELPELTVTIDEERARLGGLVDADKLHALSYDRARKLYRTLGGVVGKAYHDGQQLMK